MVCSQSRRTGCGLFLTVPFLAAALILAPAAVLAAQEQGTVVVTFDAEQYTLSDAALSQQVSVDGYGRLLVPGKPNLPSKIFAVAIPPGAKVVDVRFDVAEGVLLPGTYQIAPALLTRVIGDEDPAIYQEEQARYQAAYDSTYGGDVAYPSAPGEFVRVAGYRKYNLVDLRITPFAYQPKSGRLTHFPHCTAYVSYEIDEGRNDVMIDNLVRTERIAEEVVANYDEALTWYPPAGRASRGLHDFVIVTLDSLTSSVAPLVAWETAKGRTVEVVTTSWIDSNYGGYDQAERIRNFLRDKYPAGEWGIEDVLLVGSYDDVPMRRTAQDVGYGRPETDFYYAELSLADSQSWDSDGDHQWGESSDSIDFYSEVNVGRIPWSDPATVLSICQKSAAYEQNTDPAFKKNILLLGGYFWSDTDNAVLMETKVDQPWMADWTMTRMYEQNVDYYSTYACDYELLRTNVRSVWSNGQYAFVNWAGHGSPTSSHIYGIGAPAFIAASDCPLLNDSYPAIIFADACSNSDTDYLNIGQAMLKQGAVGFVGATKVAYGQPGWSGPYSGSTQSLDYYFTTAVTSGDYTQGEALQWAMRQMYVYGLWGDVKYETFEWGALWGNPDLGMAGLCPGDLDGDGEVDLSDLATLLANYGATSGAAYNQGDLDGDGDVDLADLAALLAVYGVACS